MTSASSLFVPIGAGACLLAVMTALVTIGSIVNDIDTMREEILSGMSDFKMTADDTWERLLTHAPAPGSSEATPAFTAFVRERRMVRARREEHSQCQCQAKSRGCPTGPPGPPGFPGPRGDQGPPGDRGRDGTPGVVLAVTFDFPGGCIQCPAGPPGPPGEPGSEGLSGFDGNKGETGPAGLDGECGAPGLAGEQGQPGLPGLEGFEGAPGMDAYQGAPGEAGPQGDMGAPGEEGQPGLPGEKGSDGNPGNDGKVGPPGRKGQDGQNGIDGRPGKNGEIGIDANYCPCPPKSESNSEPNIVRNPPTRTQTGGRQRPVPPQPTGGYSAVAGAPRTGGYESPRIPQDYSQPAPVASYEAEHPEPQTYNSPPQTGNYYKRRRF